MVQHFGPDHVSGSRRGSDGDEVDRCQGNGVAWKGWIGSNGSRLKKIQGCDACDGATNRVTFEFVCVKGESVRVFVCDECENQKTSLSARGVERGGKRGERRAA